MKRKMTSALALSILTLTLSAFPCHAVASSTGAPPASQLSITKKPDLSSPKFMLLTLLSALL
jgi:hypothetical protein